MSATKAYKDWCPLCGSRFQGDSPDDVMQQIEQHLAKGPLGKSFCEDHWRPWHVVLADNSYDAQVIVLEGDSHERN